MVARGSILSKVNKVNTYSSVFQLSEKKFLGVQIPKQFCRGGLSGNANVLDLALSLDDLL